MQFSLSHKLTAVATAATAALSTVAMFTPVQASSVFGQKEIDQTNVVAVAEPFGASFHKLLVLEQIPGKNKCWSEAGSNPVVIDPLLKNFDFTGHCRRSTDSNGYSIRIANDDYGSKYILNVVKRDGQLHLVGSPRVGNNLPEITVGRTYGMTNNYAKIMLDPAWRFTKRTYDGKTLGHFYFTANSFAAVTDPDNIPDEGPIDTPAFGDIVGDIYRNEIEESVDIGFIAGFKEDNTFRPQSPLTREQLVSMVIEAISSIDNVNVTVPTQATTQVFPDVPTSRWSAAKVQWAQENGIVEGYPDGSFKPTQEVKRSELMAVMKKAAQYAQAKAGGSAQLQPNQNVFNFSDTNGHWAQALIGEMSSYCKVATPLNESGNSFYPNSSARRNYAAAATLRTIKCVKEDS